ncbi:MBL fold metallo-hydrolase [Nocardioides agariphilus]|uniref:MBL fold metallo-hydrolase n=1 Tax=Nocardioides agariphilus TaxID=433664 RepID=A0A930VKU0_9ACTN|nr:MBL fold metallo-hydrolase [Nocardioides agariphilus]MBF4768543.1 MBL fold metallo-hydrolase [Nocardioides agariphilus]
MSGPDRRPGAIHHLNCGTMSLAVTFGERLAPRRIVAHCLLVERSEGLLLVDTGFGMGDVRREPGRMTYSSRQLLRPALDPAETAIGQLRAMGHDPRDVTDIVLTHMDFDHVGGLGDFPQATVHVFGAELDAATHPTLRERSRYRKAMWAHGPKWRVLADAGDQWEGFGAVTALDTNGADDVVLVPLHGHTRGHCGVAVRRPGDAGWLFHAGDAFFDHREAHDPPACAPGLAIFQRLMAVDHGQRMRNLERVRELRSAHTGDIDVFCAHAAADLDRFA